MKKQNINISDWNGRRYKQGRSISIKLNWIKAGKKTRRHRLILNPVTLTRVSHEAAGITVEGGDDVVRGVKLLQRGPLLLPNQHQVSETAPPHARLRQYS